MAGLSLAAGVAAVVALRGTTPAIVVIGLALYLLGLDAVEPLSQEIDHPDHTDGVPIGRGWMLSHHVAAPALALVPFALLGAVRGRAARARVVGWRAGAVRAAVLGRRVRRRRQHRARRARPAEAGPPTAAAVPPEFAGFTSTIRLVYPLAISILAGRAGARASASSPGVGTVVRMVILAALVVTATVTWISRRDEWRAKIREFMDAGRAAGGAT